LKIFGVLFYDKTNKSLFSGHFDVHMELFVGQKQGRKKGILGIVNLKSKIQT